MIMSFPSEKIISYRKNKKAQYSAEFLIVITAGFIILSVSTSILYYQMNQAKTQFRLIKSRDMAKTIASNIVKLKAISENASYFVIKNKSPVEYINITLNHEKTKKTGKLHLRIYFIDKTYFPAGNIYEDIILPLNKTSVYIPSEGVAVGREKNIILWVNSNNTVFISGEV